MAYVYSWPPPLPGGPRHLHHKVLCLWQPKAPLQGRNNLISGNSLPQKLSRTNSYLQDDIQPPRKGFKVPVLALWPTALYSRVYYSLPASMGPTFLPGGFAPKGAILNCMLNPCLSYGTQLSCHLFQEAFPDPIRQLAFLPPLGRNINFCSICLSHESHEHFEGSNHGSS